MTPGYFIISLDFELFWGLVGWRTLSEYRRNILGGRAAIPLLLDLFREFEIHATWATVGLLFFKSRLDLIESLPHVKPECSDQAFSTYNQVDNIGDDEEHDPYHFGHSLLNRIKECPNQEIASHTFSHCDCSDPRLTRAAFVEDLRAAKTVAAQHGVKLRSFVFPCNHVNDDFLPHCSTIGIDSYRGTEGSGLYCFRTRETLLRRALRLVDSYINLTGSHSFTLSDVNNTRPCNIRASGFLRPFSPRLAALEPLKVARITSQLKNAARSGEIYHLWWHPHNFGTNTAHNMRNLRTILTTFRELRSRYGMRSCTMSELIDTFQKC
jgi:peptidoglycan/xylan/chitin deacetylase (PgdA/CDA1 family)